MKREFTRVCCMQLRLLSATMASRSLTINSDMQQSITLFSKIFFIFGLCSTGQLGNFNILSCSF